MGEGSRMDEEESGHGMTQGGKLDMMKRVQGEEEQEGWSEG